MKEIVNYVDLHPNYKLKTIRKQKWAKLHNWNQIKRMRDYINNNGNHIHHYDKLNEYVYNKYRNAIDNFLPVHIIDIKRWGKQYSINNKIKFNSSIGWYHNFRNKYRIKSRKVVNIVN